jgi:hypothetical protein
LTGSGHFFDALGLGNLLKLRRVVRLLNPNRVPSVALAAKELHGTKGKYSLAINSTLLVDPEVHKKLTLGVDSPCRKERVPTTEAPQLVTNFSCH